jgi:steroid delta-isomerase-like uncharacterized protein
MVSRTDTAVVSDYVEAWNAHDADAVVETFADGGTYLDPTLSEPLTGEAIGENAADLWRTFPDLSFDIERLTRTDDGAVLLQWTMHGTQEGPLDDLPPTGETAALPGTDVIEIGEDGIVSVRGYFDGGTMMRQLGLRVDVQPRQLGPFSFGVSTRLDLGKKTEPGAFSLTYITYRDGADHDAVTGRSREVAREMAKMDGVISAVFARDDERGYTITAWEDPEDTRQLMRGGVHKAAAGELFARDGLGAGGMTSVWTLERTNGRMLRCTECLEMTYEVEAEACPECGATLPEAPPYW